MKLECSKLAQKEYKTRHDWVGKVIHWELSKKVKFDQTKKIVKLKEFEKKDKYLDLACELKKLGNMKMTFIPIVIGVLGTITK